MTVENLAIARASRDQDNTLLSPVDTLDDARQAIEDGRISPNSLMVLSLDHSDGNYGFHWFACNLASSEMLALLEVAKTNVLKDMNFIPE